MSGSAGDLAVVHAQNARLVVAYAVILDTLVTESGLLPGEGDTSSVAAIVLCSKGSERAPAAADVEQAVLGLQVELRADESELVVLQFFERLSASEVLDDTRGVNHTRTQEPGIGGGLARLRSEWFNEYVPFVEVVAT